MPSFGDKRTVPVGPAAGAGDVAASRVGTSHRPAGAAGEPEAPVGPAPEPQQNDPGTQPQQPQQPERPQQPQQPEQPGQQSEPRQPTERQQEPSRPHGDELGEAVPQDAQQGADQDPPTDAPEHEKLLERDLEELTAKAQKADEYLELAQRTKADFENFRKRAARDAAAAQERGVAKLAKELLPAVDNLDRALQAAELHSNGTETLASGIKLVHADVIAALARLGIEAYSPKGERFDPQCHEAVAQQPVEGAEPGTVVEVYQLGYRFGDSVLRPARVVVAG